MFSFYICTCEDFSYFSFFIQMPLFFTLTVYSPLQYMYMCTCSQKSIYSNAGFFIYCRIIIVCGWPMLVAFVGNPCPRIYIPMNIHTSNCLLFMKIIRLHYQWNYVPTNQENFGYPRTLTPTKKKWFHSISLVKWIDWV